MHQTTSHNGIVILRKPEMNQPVIFRSTTRGLVLNMTRSARMTLVCIVLGIVLSVFIPVRANRHNSNIERVEEIISRGIRQGELREAHEEDTTNQLHQVIGGREIQKAKVYGSLHDTGYYYMDVHIGSPPRRQSLMISMQNGIVRNDSVNIACEGCKNCGRHMDSYFDTTQSSTAEYISCKDPRCFGVCDKNGLCRFNESFHEGSEISGRYISDIISIGELSERNYPTRYNHIGCRTHESGHIRELKADGVIGFNFPNSKTMPTLLDTIFENKSIDSRVFSTCFNEYGGMMTFGGYDSSYHVEDSQGSDQVKWVRFNTDSKYEIEVKELTVGDKRLSVESQLGIAMIDVGSTYSYLPEKIHRRFMDVLNRSCDNASGCRKSNPMCWGVNNPDKLEKYFPTMKLEFERGTVVDVRPSSYLYTTVGNEVCLAVRSATDKFVLLGMSFFKHKQLIFDHGHMKFGVVEARCPQFIHRPREQMHEYPYENIMHNGSNLAQQFVQSQTTTTPSMYKEISKCSNPQYASQNPDLCKEKFEDQETQKGLAVMQMCLSNEFFRFNDFSCTHHMEIVRRAYNQCDSPSFYSQNVRNCELVRFHAQTIMQMCMIQDSRQEHQPVCHLMMILLSEQQEQCATESYFQEHDQSCNDGMHFFVLEYQIECSDEKFYNMHQEFCKKMPSFIRREEELCDNEKYNSDHTQVCEFKRFYNKSERANCYDQDQSAMSKEMCQGILSSAVIQQQQCRDQSYLQVHQSTCNGVMKLDASKTGVTLAKTTSGSSRVFETAGGSMAKTTADNSRLIETADALKHLFLCSSPDFYRDHIQFCKRTYEQRDHIIRRCSSIEYEQDNQLLCRGIWFSYQDQMQLCRGFIYYYSHSDICMELQKESPHIHDEMINGSTPFVHRNQFEGYN